VEDKQQQIPFGDDSKKANGKDQDNCEGSKVVATKNSGGGYSLD
jgi:hypothetical protein